MKAIFEPPFSGDRIVIEYTDIFSFQAGNHTKAGEYPEIEITNYLLYPIGARKFKAQFPTKEPEPF